MHACEESTIKIVPFAKRYEEEVASLILDIQTQEFGIAITLADQPDLLNVENFYQRGDGNFWVALEKNKVVGTIALIDIGNKQVAMRKMFVASPYRGKELAVAKELLDTALQWCKQKSVTQIVLGTIDKYFAAHRFYEKNGFSEISADALPVTFPRMAVDNKFYSYFL
jgi:N-acetylglutamate synthase-like GNAT family acetyltransferase